MAVIQAGGNDGQEFDGRMESERHFGRDYIWETKEGFNDYYKILDQWPRESWFPLQRLRIYEDKLISEEGQKTRRDMKSMKKYLSGIWKLRCSRFLTRRLIRILALSLTISVIWANYWNLLSLNFFVCKMGVKIYTELFSCKTSLEIYTRN